MATGDVVKLHVGAHVDGFAAISAETLVVGASADNPVTGRRADVLKAAWHAAEVAMRIIKVGNKNWAVTEAIHKVAAAWDCKPVEGARDRAFRLCRGLSRAYDLPSRHVVLPANSKSYRW